MNRKRQIIQKLLDNGVDMSKPIPEKEYNKARLQIRTTKEKVTDGARMARGRISNRAGRWQVDPEQAASNLSLCVINSCGNYDTLEGDIPVCHACNCNGKDLKYKTAQRGEKCPVGIWSNARG